MLCDRIDEAEARFGNEQKVPGLLLATDVVSASEEERLLSAHASDPCFLWAFEAGHRGAEYGWSFVGMDVHSAFDSCGGPARVVPFGPHARLGPWPAYLCAAWERCVSGAKGILPTAALARPLPDHAFVNVYENGGGLRAHVDIPAWWDDWVVGLSLGAGSVMEFAPTGKPTCQCPAPIGPPIPVWIPPRSVYVLTGDARYRFTHGIPARASDRVDGRHIPRGKRVSITFRAITPQLLPDALRAASDSVTPRLPGP